MSNSSKPNRSVAAAPLATALLGIGTCAVVSLLSSSYDLPIFKIMTVCSAVVAPLSALIVATTNVASAAAVWLASTLTFFVFGIINASGEEASVDEVTIKATNGEEVKLEKAFTMSSHVKDPKVTPVLEKMKEGLCGGPCFDAP